MKRLRKTLKFAGLTLIAILLLLTLTITAFVNMSPQFGEAPAEAQQKVFAAAANYRDGEFENQIPTSMSIGFVKTLSLIGDFFFKKGLGPPTPLPTMEVDSAQIANAANDVSRVTWFGHSAILLEMDGRKILFDPMLGQYAGPVSILSPKRYNKALPIEIEKLPFIDAVVISHDHYDHLDYGSIRKLKSKVGRFYVPLGVKSHLVSWEIDPAKVIELNWWEEAQFDGFTFICAPARHFSGRGFKRNTTLWSSWIVRSASHQLYFSGDSGYGPHFKEIGEKYGPFDFVMMECGQYNELWQAIHMMPEETVKATLDVRGKLLLPIHWGAFSLALHPWTDPITRVTAEAAKRDVPITTPKIGEPVLLDGNNFPDIRWWW